MASTLATLSMLLCLSLLFMSIDPSFAGHHHKKHHHKKHHDKHNKSRLKKLCSKTSDRESCLDFMKTDSRTSGADNRGLLEIAIDLAYSKTTDIHKDLNSLYDNSGDYRLKDRYNSCSKNYHDTMRNLDLIKKLFNDRDYDRIEVQISDSVEEVRDCKNQLENNDNDSYDLKKRTKEFELLCDVVKVSAKYLEGKDRDDKDRDDEDDEDDD
ncbi:hypothetical protein RHGRI_020580 [Rhododendron griersonianum]|uniref:Pectinesterase inhibitor domain-containing protein n=1 Tax=Rhododendron griersonianum TaxID=479676 RepID=A0AAV6JK86_9ERIC|nr:hypothetical protein RHGRI_020580 [Rhododendron griersonianum]